MISIIVPVYNKQSYIEKCINSILNQSYQDFELILINDGSSDNSKNLILQYHDPRIHLIDVKNGGVSTARNLGLSAATGKYVCFIDADDWICPDYLRNIITHAEQTDCDILIFGLTKIYPDNRKEIIKFPQISTTQIYQKFMIIQDETAPGSIGFVCNKLIRRGFLLDHHIYFDTNLRLAEDLSFYIDVFTNGPSIATSDECGYMYIQEAENSSAMAPNTDYFSLIYIWLKAYNMLILKNKLNRENQQRIYIKVIGLLEAHFLQLNYISISRISKDLAKIKSIFTSILVFGNLQPSKSILQKLILHNSALSVFCYLILRKLFHKIRQCVH